MPSLNKLMTRSTQWGTRVELWLYNKLYPGKPTIRGLKEITHALRPSVVAHVDMFAKQHVFKAPAPHIVGFAALLTSIGLAVAKPQSARLDGIFRGVSVEETVSSQWLLDSDGFYVDLDKAVALIQEQLEYLVIYYEDESRTSDIDKINRKYIDQNLAGIHAAVVGLLNVITHAPVRK